VTWLLSTVEEDKFAEEASSEPEVMAKPKMSKSAQFPPAEKCDAYVM
jgi:hypothetical protein